MLRVIHTKTLTLNIGYQPYEYSYPLHVRGEVKFESISIELKLYTLCTTIQYSQLAIEIERTEEKTFLNLVCRSETSASEKKEIK